MDGLQGMVAKYFLLDCTAHIASQRASFIVSLFALKWRYFV